MKPARTPNFTTGVFPGFCARGYPKSSPVFTGDAKRTSAQARSGHRACADTTGLSGLMARCNGLQNRACFNGTCLAHEGATMCERSLLPAATFTHSPRRRLGSALDSEARPLVKFDANFD